MRLTALVLLSTLLLVTCSSTYPKTDHRHWPAGVRTTNLAPHLAQVTNCLNNPTTNEACGVLTPGRATTSADWCARSSSYANGAIALHEVLSGTVIDVIIVPAADDTEWREGAPGNIVGFVGSVLQDIATRGGFRINAYIIRGVSASDPTDAYSGSWTALLADWAPRGDMMANWWTDVSSRRALGVQYLASFYQLDITLVTKYNLPQAVDEGLTFRKAFAFLEPFEYANTSTSVHSTTSALTLRRKVSRSQGLRTQSTRTRARCAFVHPSHSVCATWHVCNVCVCVCVCATHV